MPGVLPRRARLDVDVDVWALPAAQPATRRHADLRRVLAGYLDVAPDDVVLRTGRFGKPRLDPPVPLHFSLSSCGGSAYVAVARHLVGVDVERVDHVTGLAARTGSTAPDRTTMEAWTTREAALKALGCGLHEAVPVAVDCAPSRTPRLTRLGHDDPACWSLLTDWPAPDVVVSVAVRAPGAGWSMRELPELAEPLR